MIFFFANFEQSRLEMQNKTKKSNFYISFSRAKNFLSLPLAIEIEEGNKLFGTDKGRLKPAFFNLGC